MKLFTFFIVGLSFILKVAAAPSGYTYISPVPGSEFNPRNSEIIIKSENSAVKASDLVRELKITGSVSGVHVPVVLLADDSKTINIKTDRQFEPSEIVTVSVNQGLLQKTGQEFEPYAFAFKVTTLREPINYNDLKTGDNKQFAHFDTIPADFPKIKVSNLGNPAPGYVFLTNYATSAATYLILLDSAGNPYGGKKTLIPSFDFKVQPNGWLSYQQPLRPTPVGNGWAPSIIFVCDTFYNTVDNYQCTNGYTADLHDFMLAPNGHAFLFCYDPQPVDMSKIVKGGDPNAIVIGTIIQEFDSKKNLVFQWRSWDHYSIHDTYMDTTLPVIDYVHINAIELDIDDNLMISCRHLNEITKINHQTGDIMWRLGGKRNDFTFKNEHPENAPTYFAEQHDIRRLVNGNITLFDNGNLHVPEYSRGVEYSLDEVNKTATLVWEFRHDPDIPSKNQGATQRLPDGSTLICWGGAGTFGFVSVTEVDSKNQVQLELTMPMGVSSGQTTYRAYKFPWVPGLASAIDTKSKFLVGDVLDFANAGVKIKVQELTSDPNNALTVEHYEWAPIRPEFTGRAPHVLKYRVMLKPNLITQARMELRFKLTQFPWVKFPDKYSIYRRDTAKGGVFESLPTTYDAVNGELVTTTTKFGEFIFGMTVNLPQPTVPKLISPYEGQKADATKNTTFQWTPEGYINRSHIQISHDNTFGSDLIVDDTTKTISVIFKKIQPQDQVCYWRVRCNNDAGWGPWSTTGSFTPVAPFISIITPNGGEKWWRDSVNYIIRWEENLTDTINIDLFHKDAYFLRVATITRKTGACFWTIPDIVPFDSTYKLRLSSVSDTSIFSMSKNYFSVVPAGTNGVSEMGYQNNNSEFALNTYPNPLNEKTRIFFRMNRQENVKLKVFDIFGREIVTLLDELVPEGSFETEWKPVGLSTGFYFIKLITASGTEVVTVIYEK